MDQEIFEWNDGTKKRRGDPYQLLRLLWENLTNYGGRLEDYFSGDPQRRFPAQVDLVAVTRKVFELKAWDEKTNEGLTEGKTLDVLLDFHEFMDDEKKSPDSNQTSPPPTAPGS